MRHNMTFVGLLVSASAASADKGQIPSLASGWPKTEGFWHVFPRHHCSGHLLECKDGMVACLELWRPPVSCGQGCFENNSLIWKCFVNFHKREFVNDEISVLQEWWLSGSQKWRLRDLNVLIIWPEPAGMNCRHKSLRAVPPGVLVSSDSLTASFSHWSLQKPVIPPVFGWLPGEFARETTREKDPLLLHLKEKDREFQFPWYKLKD